MRDFCENIQTIGSYAPEDVTFLLKEVHIPFTEITEKERLIQSKAKHYSEMLSEERRPDERYLELFEAACESGVPRIAREIQGLALRIKEDIAAGTLPSNVTLCSLVRAGVPYGVLLLRALKRLDVDVVHYGVSIIRDFGLDEVALDHATKDRPIEGVIFVDGWTGKGAIFTELSRSWREITGREVKFLVLADPAGLASYAGSHEDWLIPSGILGANISGLISRSILSDTLIGPGDFHGFMPVEHLADIDLSRDFVDRITRHFSDSSMDPRPHASSVHRERLKTGAKNAIMRISDTFGIENLNRIKPGIAEATRAILRRKPDFLFIRDKRDPDLAALLHLCETDHLRWVQDPKMTGPYRAITVIDRV